MPNIYFETDKLKDLSNESLVEKHSKISEKYTLLNNKNIPLEMRQQIAMMYEIYDNELNRRLIEGLIDDDELEEIYEANENM